jgi:membrane protein DedA with SNARE-associated domain
MTEILAYILKILTVFVASADELFFGIPIGFGFGMDPILICVLAITGGITGGILVVTLGDRLRQWLLKRHKKKDSDENKKPSAIQRVWEKYGVVGLGLLAPLLTGVPIGSALGIAFGAPRAKLILWMSIGTIIWSILMVTAGTLGLEVFDTLAK